MPVYPSYPSSKRINENTTRVMNIVRNFEGDSAVSCPPPPPPLAGAKYAKKITKSNIDVSSVGKRVKESSSIDRMSANLNQSLPGVGPYSPLKHHVEFQGRFEADMNKGQCSSEFETGKQFQRQLTLEDILLGPNHHNGLEQIGDNFQSIRNHHRNNLTSDRNSESKRGGNRRMRRSENDRTPRFTRPTQSWLKYQEARSSLPCEVQNLCHQHRSLSWVNLAKSNSSPSPPCPLLLLTSQNDDDVSVPRYQEEKRSSANLNRSSMYWFSNPDMDQNGQYFVEKRWKDSLRNFDEDHQWQSYVKKPCSLISKQVQEKIASPTGMRNNKTTTTSENNLPEPHLYETTPLSSGRSTSLFKNKAVSLDNVAYRASSSRTGSAAGSRHKSPKPPSSARSRGDLNNIQVTTPLARYCTLDTVCEGKVMNESALFNFKEKKLKFINDEYNRYIMRKKKSGDDDEDDGTRKQMMIEGKNVEEKQSNKTMIDCNTSSNHTTISRYFSEVNLLQQCKSLGRVATCSDNIMLKEQLPLKYKRDSYLRRYGNHKKSTSSPSSGDEKSEVKKKDSTKKIIEKQDKTTSQTISLDTDSSQNISQSQYASSVAVELEPEPTFERRNVVARKNVSLDSEYTIVDLLGRGKFGEVKRCIEKKSKKELAVKIVPIRSEAERKDVYNEIEVMNSLQHPRLLQLYDAVESKRDIALIMELISGGELFERVIDEDFILTEMLCELYVRQICEGVAFMHHENFLHLDMKPENILCVNRDGHRIKIIDFGLARKFKPGDCLKILFGTPEFVAPEVIAYEKIGQGTDMWSIGVICFVLLSGLSPFMGDNDAETYNNIARVAYDFEDEAFDEISDEAKDFISKLLKDKKEDRLLAEDCLKHPWLTRHQKKLDLSTISLSSTVDDQKINTSKLRRFVIRRRWQKAVNALLALKRMGMSL